MNKNQQNRWLIDAALFIGFLTCFYLDLTGVALHQWIGMAGGALALYHLVTHWNWVRAVTSRFFGRTSNQARRYYLVDAGILTGFLAMLGTGLVISTWLNLSLTNYEAWRTVHVAASLTTLLAVTLKIGLHASWVVSVGKKIFASPAVAPQTPDSDRRAVLKLIGVTGIASLVAFSNSVGGLAESNANVENGSGVTAAADTTSTNISVSTSSQSTASTYACAVLCGRKCSYPGHCRRYTDSNANGRCDLGECQS